jgi:DnaJ-class molecular chaperone
MMLDPAYAGLSFGQLCSRAGLSGGEVMRLICQRQLAEGMMRMAYHLPDVMEDVALAALDRSGTCAKCTGSGSVSGAPCADCRGSGEVHVPGDIRAVRLVFGMFGIPQRPDLG